MEFTLNTNDINDTIAELSQSLNELEDVAGDVGELASDFFTGDWGDLKKDWENLKKDAEEFVNEIKDTIKCLKKIVKLAIDYAEDAMKKVKERFEETIDYVSEKIDGAIEYATDVVEEVQAFISNKIDIAVEWVKYAKDFVLEEVLPTVAASIVNLRISLVKGLAVGFGQILDGLTGLGTVVLTIYTAAYDLGQQIFIGDDYEWHSATEALWARTMDIVSYEVVDPAFNYFYQSTEVGQWLDENAALPFKSDEIGCVLGEGFGIMVSEQTFAILTGIPPEAVSAISGFGRGIEAAWQNGAGPLEGIGQGIVTGAWDASTRKLDQIIGSIGVKGIKTTILKSLLDVGAGTVDSFAQVGIDAFFNDKSLIEAWEDAGGVNELIKQIAINGAFSFVDASIDYSGNRARSNGSDVTTKLNTTEKLDTTTKNDVSDNITEKLDGTTKNIDDYSKNEVRKIKQEILDSIPDGLDDVSKIRKIYIELNKRVNYDPNYLGAARNKDVITKQNIIDSIKSFDDLNSNGNVVCAGWANLYQEALIAAGIDPSKVKIMTTSDNLHFWVEIDMGDYIIVADSTDVINHSTDLSNSKSNSSTNGFIILDKSMSGTRISTLSKNNPNYLNQVYENQNDWLRIIDDNIGYTDNSKYFNETVKDLQNEFSNEGVIDRLFGSNEKKFNKKVDFFMEIDIPDGMKAYEAYAYYNQIKFNIFSKDELSSVKINITQRKTSHGYCGLLSFDCGDKYCIIDDELGRMDFDNLRDYYNKIQQLTQE